jgi:TolB protein
MASRFHVGRARAWCAAAVALVAVSASLTAAQAAPPTRKVATIVFESSWDGTSQIYRMDPDGSGVTRLTNNATYDHDPSLSPTGKKIAFTRLHGDNFEIYAMNVDGTGQARLTFNAIDESAPSWSPDGTKIAFARPMRNGKQDIFTMNADGSGQVNLTNTLDGETSPSWSPDGTKIVFYRSNSTCCGGDLFTMNADGTAQSLLATNGFHPSWSPDGTKIAFAADDGVVNNIYTIRSNGAGRTNLTNFTEPTYGDSGGGGNPSWSPDGSKIAFDHSLRDDADDIFTMNADGSGQVGIAFGGASELPSWGFRVVHGKPAPSSDCGDIKIC